MAAAYDIVVIGAGHNGLVTTWFLARAGLKTLVLERREIVGGSAITEELFPGFRCPTLAHSGGHLGHLEEDLQLARHGLRRTHAQTVVFAPSPDGRALCLTGQAERTAQEIARFSRKDAEKFPEFCELLSRLARFFIRLRDVPPPELNNPGAADVWNLLQTGRSFRGLGKKNMQRLLRWAPMPVADLVGGWFESEPLRAVIAAQGVFGTSLAPRSPGSGAVLLLSAAAFPLFGGPLPIISGGMGALTAALAAAAREAGAEMRVGADVAQVLVKDGRAGGVVLAGGEEIAAKAVVSNADPRRTFLRLLDPVHLSPDFLFKMQHYRCQGTVAKVNLTLAGLPVFTAAPNAAAHPDSPLAGRIHIGPEMDYLERAYDDSKYGNFSRQPYLDITIPSIADPALAPAGKHVMSICAQFAPFALKNGDWKAQRDALAETVIRTLSTYAPNLPELILHRQVITPLDLEETYGLTGGHIFHGETSLDQLFTMRPMLGWARYRTPIAGLYLCGSGTHPGYGITGASGRNAAREILKDLRRR